MRTWKVVLGEAKNPMARVSNLLVVADDWIAAGKVAIETEKEWAEKTTVHSVELDGEIDAIAKEEGK